MQQLELFVEMSELEQRVQLSGHLPSVESYQRRRMGTSAVAVCLAIHEYAPSRPFNLVLDLIHTRSIGTPWTCACHSTFSIVALCNRSGTRRMS